MSTGGIVICGTGHRPDKIILGGLTAYHERVFQRLVDLAAAAIKRERPSRVISGMALGWDMALAEAAIREGIAFDAYIPFEGQESRWPEKSQAQYRRLRAAARKAVVVCPGGYAASKMQKRNEAMVDAADRVLALWNGSSGGTANCVAYAERIGRPVVALWRSWERFAARP